MDAVLKIGGSLAEDPDRLKALCTKLSDFAKRFAIILVPGGGRFADVVRDFDQRFIFSNGIAHRMAILGMDQIGLLLCQIIPNSCATYLLKDVKQLSEIKVVPILLPSRLMFQKAPLENSWNVTSDSIAVYIATLLHVTKVLLVTDVDGIFTKDPKKYSDAMLMGKLSAEDLLKLNERTSVDRYLPKLLLESPIDCYVVNGKHPERIEAILAGQRTTCTLITARNQKYRL